MTVWRKTFGDCLLVCRVFGALAMRLGAEVAVFAELESGVKTLQLNKYITSPPSDICPTGVILILNIHVVLFLFFAGFAVAPFPFGVAAFCASGFYREGCVSVVIFPASCVWAFGAAARSIRRRSCFVRGIGNRPEPDIRFLCCPVHIYPRLRPCLRCCTPICRGF